MPGGGTGVFRWLHFGLVMAATPQNNIQTFLENIPNIISEARRQLYSDNISVIEFNIRRLEDSLYVINILYQHSVARNEIGDQQLQGNLAQLLFEVQRLCSEYDELWIRNGIPDASISFACPLEEGGVGRRRYDLPESAIVGLYRIHRNWSQVAREVRVSYRTVLRRRHQLGLPVSGTNGPRNTYTNISQSDLCNIVREVLQILPNAGETFVQGALRQRNIHVQRWRVKNTIQLVDPLSRAMRRSVAILRRVYNVPCPNALWLVSQFYH